MAFLDIISRVENAARLVAKPPPLLTVSQWADEHLYLSPEESSEAGKYRVDRAPYQREMLDAVSDPNIREVVYCTSSQVGKTLLGKSILGYHIHQDPGPILVIQPNKEMAETFSKDRLATMIRDSPVLRGLIADPKSRSSGNTILHKNFAGGQVTLIGANSPSGMASRPIRIVFADEVDRYPVSAGTEGDPIFLARQRSVTYWNRKFVMASTPTNKDQSRIWWAFEKSDKRYYHLPCPHCGELHTLAWKQVIWDDGDPTSARAVCPVCGSFYENADKLKMLAAGEWRKTAVNPRVAGFHISALYSPWQTFSDVVQEFLDKKDHPETLKTFVNLQLGETYEDRSGEAIDETGLMARRELWEAIPADVLLLTAGCDVQKDRIEVSILGWNSKEQAKVLQHLRIMGNPSEPSVWNDLDDVLLETWMNEAGHYLAIRAACIDSGGHHTEQVYQFCGARGGRRVLAIKGRAGQHPIWPTKLSRKKLKHGASLHLVGVDTAKDHIHAALSVLDPELPRYVSFSQNLPEDYFAQLVSERRVTKYDGKGGAVRSWVKKAGDRNEALDCFVYALAALKALQAGNANLLRLMRPRYVEPRPKTEAAAPPPTLRRPVARRTSSAIL